MLNPTQKDIQELQKEFEDDARERAKEIAQSEQFDSELMKREKLVRLVSVTGPTIMSAS